MRIAALYDERLVAAPEHRAMGAALRDAFAATVAGVLSITGHAKLSDGNPTLRHLIGMRGPHVDPLNVVQVETLARLRAEPDSTQLRDLLMLTINGVAAGMRNTCVDTTATHTHYTAPRHITPYTALRRPRPSHPQGLTAAAAARPARRSARRRRWNATRRALILLCSVLNPVNLSLKSRGREVRGRSTAAAARSEGELARASAARDARAVISPRPPSIAPRK